jgi:diacylglycerol kinase (ATP)
MLLHFSCTSPAALIGDNLTMTQASTEPVKKSVSDTAPESTREAADAQKSRSGLHRILHAAGYSLQGLRAGWNETAFRQEALASIVLLPAAFFVGRSWFEVAMLIAVVVFVLVTELLNTGIETAIDRIGPEWHDLSKRAKDMGSAAVLLSILLCAGVWLAAIYARFLAG